MQPHSQTTLRLWPPPLDETHLSESTKLPRPRKTIDALGRRVRWGRARRISWRFQTLEWCSCHGNAAEQACDLSLGPFNSRKALSRPVCHPNEGMPQTIPFCAGICYEEQRAAALNE